MINEDTLLIIDGYGFVYRAYHVQPPLTAPNGNPVGAIYGLTSMLIKLLSDFKPLHVVIVFDSQEQNFRHKIYDQYKANRPAPPEDLILQLESVRDVAQSLNIPIIEKAGYEADDLIASIATQLPSGIKDAIIVSADKDLMQLINNQVQMYDPMKSKYIAADDVVAKFGVRPSLVREVMALIGDRSDNIPGVKSIGPKTAATLITQFGSVNKILSNIEQIQNTRQREIISKSKDDVLLSLQLVSLQNNIELTLDIDYFKWKAPKADKISTFLSKNGFKSLRARAENLFNIKIDLSDISDNNTEQSHNDAQELVIKQINTDDELSNLLSMVDHHGVCSLDFARTSNNNAYKANIQRFVAFAVNGHCYLIYEKEFNWTLPRIIPYLENISIKKITYSINDLYEYFDSLGFHCYFEACDSIELMNYALSIGLKHHNPFDKALDKELHQLKNNIADSESFIKHHISIVRSFEQQYLNLIQQLKASSILHLYIELDLPLSRVLQVIRRNGIKIDAKYLQQLSQEFTLEINNIEDKIFAITGVRFNIASTKQLGEVLFDKMQLPHGKLSARSKTYSTSVEVLEQLADHGYNIANLLLRWRQLTKLKNTYTDSLLEHIYDDTCLIHTTLLQTSTNTARLSSQNPNLQNIPIRSKDGNKIRAAFVAKPDHVLISADYSQIELRILSHIAKIDTLRKAFQHNQDIHNETARSVFNISDNDAVTPEYRRKAKAINFGIIYGISAFGLSKQINVTSNQAALYIKEYFKQYPGIEEYMEITKEYARKYGYVRNLYGRKCFISAINDKNFNIRQFAERAAINAPIQSTNADIIKIAMVKLDKYLSKHKLKSKMILQIHDELLFEVPIDEINTITPVINDIMINSTELDLPMLVEIKSGKNWMDTKIK